MRTKHHARKLAKQLNQAGIPSVDLHGNLSQPARDRNLAAFTAGTAAAAQLYKWVDERGVVPTEERKG